VVLRMVVGLVLTAVALAIAGRRLWWLGRVALSGQPAPERARYAKAHLAGDLKTQLTEVIGQRKLLKWTVPGAAHAATFWGFLVLLLTIVEAYGALFSRTFYIPGIGQSAALGFIEDLFATGVLAGIVVFTVIRWRTSPRKEGRRSRFFGSHTTAAWAVLWMIAAVVVTLLVYRGAQENTGVFPYAGDGAWPFASWVVGRWLHPLGYGVNSVLEAVFILAQLAVVLAFLIIVVYSKHLHIFLAPLNVMFSRRPDALGPLEPMRSNGTVLDFEEADPDVESAGADRVVDRQAPQRAKSIFPPDLFALRVGTARIADSDLINPEAALGDLHCHFRFEAEAVFLQRDGLNHLAPECFVAGLHIGQVEVGDHVGDQRQKPVSNRVPEIEHPMRPRTDKAGPVHHVGLTALKRTQ